MPTPLMRRFLAERELHDPACSFVNAQRWFAAINMLAPGDRIHPVAANDPSWICVECGHVLRTGAEPYPTRGEIAAKRQELQEAGLPSGDRSVARALHSSESTIRRREGRRK